MKALPTWISMREMAEVLGWERRQTSYFFSRHGGAVKLGHKLFITRDSLRERFPEVYDVLVARYDGGDDDT